MSKLLTKHRPSPALLIACAALFVALGGTSFALPGRNRVDRNDLRANVVGARNIKNAAVRRRHIKEFAVGRRQLANAAVRTRKLRDSAVTNSKIQTGAVNALKIAPGSVIGPKLGAVIVRTATSPLTADADGTSNGGAVGIATATVQCGTGERLLSGGARWVTNNTPETTKQLFLRESHPSGNGWRAVGNVDFGAQGQAQLQVQVVCLR
jgi:hypothetical protein